MIIFLDDIIPNPVNCPNGCGRFYSGHLRKGNLNRHLNLECGVSRKFECRYCWKRFARKNELKKHCNRIHKSILNNKYST